MLQSASIIAPHAATVPLDQIDVSDPQLYFDDVWQPYFERLRRDDPVHYVADSPYGPYWAITKYKDIIHLEVNHKAFSSSWELGGIRIEDIPSGYERPSFILLDPPDHDEQRLVVSPTVNPINLAKMETLIRERTGQVLEALPRGEEFNWVDRVSIELTSMMLCTLFDYPGRGPAAVGLLVGSRDHRRQRAQRAGEVGSGAVCDPDGIHRASERALGGTGEVAAELRHHLDSCAQRHR